MTDQAPWTYIEDIGQHEGKTVTLKGWLYNKRSSGKLHFLLVRDGTGVLQCVVFKKDVPEEQFAVADHLPQESSLIVTGTVRKDDRAPLGYELGVTNLEVIHQAEEYPITPKEHGVAFLLDHRHLWVRSARQHAVLRIRSEVVRACREYFDSRGFVLFDSPILTPAACEGTTTLFETPYFDEKAYLTQSGQLYVEAGALAFGKVYCFGPTFRAEKSKTRRHLMEFWMVEPEVAFMDLAGDMDLAEDFVASIVAQVLSKRRRDLELLERDVTALEKIAKPFPRITYSEALDLLKEKGFAVEWGADFGAEEETAIAQSFDRPVLVHRYPIECKAFYMKADPADPRVALCVDMLAPEGYGEIIGGGQREDDFATLQAKIREHNLPEEAFGWYLDLRRYGSVPHSGFGMGIERVVTWLCGIPHLRETIPFPRMLERLRP
jgi:asparaginyl-tRNA synthetase